MSESKRIILLSEDDVFDAIGSMWLLKNRSEEFRQAELYHCTFMTRVPLKGSPETSVRVELALRSPAC